MTMHRFVFNFSIIAVLCCCSSTITLGQKEYLVTVQPNTGSFSIIDSLPEVEQIQIMPAYTTFDETNHHFIFKGIDSGGDNRLYTIDAPTGAILYNPLFPQLGDASDNILKHNLTVN